MERVFCEICQLEAHKYCYSPSSKSKIIKCGGCRAQEKQGVKVNCCVCLSSEGMMKRIKNSESRFGHIICLLFSPYFLVESYQQLDFLQIAPMINTQNFLCALCDRLGSKQSSCHCSFMNCSQAIHWRCLFKSYRDGSWVSSIKRLNFLNKSRISFNTFYSRIQTYLNKYFGELIFQTDDYHRNIETERCIEVACKKHSQNIVQRCKCERKIKSGFILCFYCKSVNHLKCEHKQKVAVSDEYKCLQCQDWEAVVKKKKRPYLSEYPNMNIYDYIYIHCFYQESNYKLSNREPTLICRLPIYPSLYFFRHFLQNYAITELNSQISVQRLRLEADNEEPHIVDTKQITKAMKLVKILLSEYKNLQKLKHQFMQINHEFNVTHSQIIKTLREYDKKMMKFRKNSPNPALFEKSITKTQPQLKIHRAKTGKQEQNSQDNDIINQVKNSCEQFTVCISIPSCKQEEQQISQSQEQEGVLQLNGVQDYILKQIQQIKDKSALSLLDWERDLLLRKQEKYMQRSSCCIDKDTQLLQKICLKALQMDLKDQNYGLHLDSRIQMLQFVKIQTSKSPHKFKSSQKIVQIQEFLMNFMLDINKTSGIFLSLLSDIQKVSIEQIKNGLSINIFLQLKGLHLSEYNLFFKTFKDLGQKWVQSEKSISSYQQIEAYEVIITQFYIKSQWLEREICKKAEVQKNISRVVTQLERGDLKKYFVEENAPENLSSHILQSAAVFCRLHEINYLLPKIQQYIAWNKVYQSCVHEIPISYLCPTKSNYQNKKLNGQAISRIISLMKQSNFPRNRIHNLIESYADKYRESRECLLNFLQIFDMNIKGNSSRNIKYFQKQVLQWLKEARNSVFQLDSITREVEQVVDLFKELKTRISKTSPEHDQQGYRYLLDKLDTIPIVFDTNQQNQKQKSEILMKF